MLKPTDQTSHKYRIAAFNARLNRNSICPANHNVLYRNGWYYLDGEPRQDRGITAKAKEFEDDPNVMVYYSQSYNTYVLSQVNYVGGSPTPVRGSVHV